MATASKKILDEIKHWENFMVGDTVLKSPINEHKQKNADKDKKHFTDAEVVTFRTVFERRTVHSLLFLQ